MRGDTDSARRTVSSLHRRPRRRPPVALLRAAALLLALTAATLGAACSGPSGGTPGGDAGEAGGSTETYTSRDYGFSITYDTLLTQGAPSEGDDSGAVFSIPFVDTEGARAATAYLDGVQVSVFKLARAVSEGEVAGLEQQVRDTVDGRMTKLRSGKIVEPVKRTTVNGTPGFTVSYTFAQGGAAVSAVSAFLFSGEYQYEVTGQASDADRTRLEPVIEAAMASFTVL